MNILEPFKRLTIFEPVEKDGETTEKKVTVGIIYRSDGLYAWDNSRAIPNEYDEAIKWSPASQLSEYAIRRKAIVTKFEYKPLRSFTADDIKLLRLDYASQDDPQLLMEEYLPIKNFELLYGWWKQHYKATLKDCDNPQAIILHLASDEKIAKRFLEFYHTGQFNTNVALDDNAVLIDGYSAYLVAQKVGLAFLPAIYKEV